MIDGRRFGRNKTQNGLVIEKIKRVSSFEKKKIIINRDRQMSPSFLENVQKLLFSLSKT